MRRYRNIFILAFAAALSVACAKEKDAPGQDFVGITLQFDCGSFPETKAKIDSAGVAKYNENLLNSVEYFLYPDNGTGNDAVNLYGIFFQIVTDVFE